MEDRESAEQRAVEWEKRFQKIRLSLASSLNIDLSVTSDHSFDMASAKVGSRCGVCVLGVSVQDVVCVCVCVGCVCSRCGVCVCMC